MSSQQIGDRKAWRLALLGNPVSHSLSPLIYATAFEADGHTVSYVACPVESIDMPAALTGLRALGFQGGNVTIPHKQTVASLVSNLSREAEATGAVNCLEWDEQGWIGHNTDVAGFLKPLFPHFGELEGKHSLVLGAGGAASAVVYALTKYMSMSITLAARDKGQATDLLSRLGLPGEVLDYSEASSCLSKASLVVNATPVGMDGRSTPLPRCEGLTPEHFIYDLVYSPPETPLMATAKMGGATIIGGLPMLVGQAAAAYRIWTGRNMRTDVVLRSLSKYMEREESA